MVLWWRKKPRAPVANGLSDTITVLTVKCAVYCIAACVSLFGSRVGSATVVVFKAQIQTFAAELEQALAPLQRLHDRLASPDRRRRRRPMENPSVSEGMHET